MIAPAPILTIGIVTFHTPLDVLEKTLASLTSCAVPYEIVIVDNTLSEEYFAKLQAHTKLRCVRSPANRGYGFGHNLAVQHVQHAPYHLVLNPDVVVHPGCLEALVAMMERTPEVGLIVPRVHNVDGSLQHLNKRDPSMLDLGIRRFVPKCLHALPMIQRRLDYYVTKDIGYDAPCEVPYASGCFMLFRRTVWDAVGGFDEGIFLHMEDADITRRVRAIARVLFYPDAVITHLWARSSHKSLRFTLVTIVSALYYFRKWGWKWW